MLVRANAADRVARVDDLHVRDQEEEPQVVDRIRHIFTVRRDDLRRVREARERRGRGFPRLIIGGRSHDDLRVQRSAHDLVAARRLESSISVVPQLPPRVPFCLVVRCKRRQRPPRPRFC